MSLDEFSRGFSKILFQEYPEWKFYAIEEIYDGSTDSYLVVKIPSPQKDLELFISTFDEEVTIGFDNYHTHESFDTTEGIYIQAMQFINDLIEEKIYVVVEKKMNEWVSSYTINYCDVMPQMEKGISYYIRSWKGTYNKN